MQVQWSVTRDDGLLVVQHVCLCLPLFVKEFEGEEGYLDLTKLTDPFVHPPPSGTAQPSLFPPC